MAKHGRLIYLLLLLPLAGASTYLEFHGALNKIKSQLSIGEHRQARDSVGYNGENVEKWRTIIPTSPTQLENVPISCENDDRNYCNYPDLVPFESTNIQEIMKFPIPSGRCPEGYSRVPTFDCLNFAPALFETTCCVYNAPPPQPVQMCPIDPNNVIINALAKLCDGRILLVTYLKQENRQVVWQLDQNLKLNRSTPYRVEDVTGNAVNGDDNQIVGTVPDGDCGIAWIYRVLANDQIKVVTVKYMGKITAGAKDNIEAADSGFNDLGNLKPIVVKLADNKAPESNSVYAGFGLGKLWAFVSFLNVKETGLDHCTTFVRVNHWQFDNAAMDNWRRIKPEQISTGGSGSTSPSSTPTPPSSSSSAYGSSGSASSSGDSSSGDSSAVSNVVLSQLAQDLRDCILKGLYYDDRTDVIVGMSASGKIMKYKRDGMLSDQSSDQLDVNAIVCNIQSTPKPGSGGSSGNVTTTGSPEIIVYVPMPMQQYGGGGGGGGATYGSPPSNTYNAHAQQPQGNAVYGQQSSPLEDDSNASQYLQGRKPASFRYQRKSNEQQ